MDAVEYTKTLRRLCKSQADCPECPLHENCKEDGYVYCIADVSEYVEKAVQIVEQWAKDNPTKTRQSEFLKQFPNADLSRLQPCMIEKDKRPTRCTKYIDKVGLSFCDDCRNDYWNEEVTDND